MTMLYDEVPPKVCVQNSLNRVEDAQRATGELLDSNPTTKRRMILLETRDAALAEAQVWATLAIATRGLFP